MKTQPITITSTIESTTNNSRMKSCCADSIPKSTHANSKSKSLKSTPTDYRVEFLLGIPNRKLFLANSKLEFVVELKFPTSSLKRCLLVEFQLFGWSLLKSIEPKIVFGLVVPYIGSLMLVTGFFQLTMVFGWVWFSVESSLKSSIESSLCSLPLSMVASNPLRSYLKYQ